MVSLIEIIFISSNLFQIHVDCVSVIASFCQAIVHFILIAGIQRFTRQQPFKIATSLLYPEERLAASESSPRFGTVLYRRITLISIEHRMKFVSSYALRAIVSSTECAIRLATISLSYWSRWITKIISAVIRAIFMIISG